MDCGRTGRFASDPPSGRDGRTNVYRYTRRSGKLTGWLAGIRVSQRASGLKG